MRRKRIALIAVAVFLVLPVFEIFYGVNIAYAQNNIDPVKTREWQSPDPGSPSGSGGSSADPGSPSGSGGSSANVPLVPASSPVSHTHDFQYVTVQEASENQDEVVQLRCACGDVAESFTVPGSAVGVFIKRVVKEITNASKDAVVTVDTKICTCYNQVIIDALLKRPDVTLVTNYRYNHVDYSVTIPAGYDVSTLLDENGYCGFRYLDQILGE